MHTLTFHGELSYKVGAWKMENEVVR